MRYEDLIVHPSETIATLNTYLETGLTIEDLKHIYRKPLYRTPASSTRDFIKAVLIYLKNYSQRIDVAIERKLACQTPANASVDRSTETRTPVL